MTFLRRYASVNLLRRCRPSAPVVINLIALSIVIGGQAVALPGKQRVKRNDLAAGAVTARNLAPGAVTRRKLGRRAVKSADLATQVVSGRTVRPGSVTGRALMGTIQIPGSIADADPSGDGGDFTWTNSGGTATCPPGSVLLNGGLRIQDSPFHRTFIQGTYPGSGNSSTWVGAISSDSGGLSPATVFAHCLS